MLLIISTGYKPEDSVAKLKLQSLLRIFTPGDKPLVPSLYIVITQFRIFKNNINPVKLI